MTQTEGTKSSYTLTKEPCSGLTAEGKQCQRPGVRQDKNEAWWCGLHDPEKKAEREAKKEAQQQAAEVEADSEVVLNDKVVEATAEMAARVLPQAIAIATDAMNALSEVAWCRDTGWPENTHQEKYRVLVRTMNQRAQEAAETVRVGLAKIKAELKGSD